MLPNILQGTSLLLHKSFLILGNAAKCAPLRIPQNASEDDIRVLFSHVVLSTAVTIGADMTSPVALYLPLWLAGTHLALSRRNRPGSPPQPRGWTPCSWSAPSPADPRLSPP